MLVRMADRGGGVTDMAWGLLMRRSSCCHCSKKKKWNKISNNDNKLEINKGRELCVRTWQDKNPAAAKWSEQEK